MGVWVVLVMMMGFMRGFIFVFYFGVMCSVLFSWMILLLSMGFLMIWCISVVNFVGLLRCGGNGMVVFRFFCILGGSFVIIGVVKMLGVMVMIWMLWWVSLCVVGSVSVVILFFEVV